MTDQKRRQCHLRLKAIYGLNPILHTVALKQHTNEMQYSHVNLAFQP